MKNRVFWAIVSVGILIMPGCAGVQKKFTRKPKEPTRRTSVMVVEKAAFQKPFSNEYYYKSHYTMWETWHGELIEDIGGNRKKVSRDAQETYGRLRDLSGYLKPEKRARLEPLLADLKKITDKLDGNNYSKSDEAGIRTELEKLKRLVSNDYYYAKVKDDVLPDNVDLGNSAPPPAP